MVSEVALPVPPEGSMLFIDGDVWVALVMLDPEKAQHVLDSFDRIRRYVEVAARETRAPVLAPPAPDPETCRHRWAFTGTAYGGDDDRWHGDGRAYCLLCGADGDA